MLSAMVASVGVLSLPVAAALDGDRPWWDYRAWDWFGGGKVITFDWNHEYGPLEWSRSGATMLNVKSDRPHYWKVETLDGFDGLRWYRTGDLDETRYGQEIWTLYERAQLTPDSPLTGRWRPPNRRVDTNSVLREIQAAAREARDRRN